MVAEVFAGISAFNAMLNAAKTLRDMDNTVERNGAVIDLQGQILAAQEGYAYAVSDRNLESTEVDWADVSYIGKSVGQRGIGGRWTEVNRCIEGGLGSGPGREMHRRFGLYCDWKQMLFVAAMPVDFSWMELDAEVTLKLGWVAFLEYEALAEFRKSTDRRRPAYNLH